MNSLSFSIPAYIYLLLFIYLWGFFVSFIALLVVDTDKDKASKKNTLIGAFLWPLVIPSILLAKALSK